MKNRTLFPINRAQKPATFDSHKFYTLPVYQRKHRIPRGKAYYRLHQLEWKAMAKRLKDLHDQIVRTVDEYKLNKTGDKQK